MTADPIPSPPFWAERLLKWCIGRHEASTCIVGDLRQEYVAIARSHSARTARRWYCVQVVAISLRYVGRRAGSSGVRRRAPRIATPSLDAAVQNVSYAIRGLRRGPGFSAAIVVTLALGIGANATMFGVVDRLLLSPPQHLVKADRLRLLSLDGLGQRSVNSPRAYSFPDYRAIEHLPVLEAAAAYSRTRSWTMGSGPEARKVRVQQTSASLFPTLGVVPVEGRFYNGTDDAAGAPATAVLSEEFWEREFGRDAGVLGRTLALNRGRYEVIGVAPAGFTGPELTAVDVWVPLETSSALEDGWAPLESRGAWWWRVVVRLNTGVTNEAANEQLTTAHLAGIAAYLGQGGYPHTNSMGGRVVTGSVIAARGPGASTTTDVSLWLAGVSLFVLLIACANVANLLLTRGVRTRRELAIRMALGADRRRLASQLLTEAIVLAGLGALAALIVSQWSSSLVHGILFPGVAFTDTGMNGRLLLFMSVATAVTALAAGILPAVQAGATSPADALRSASRGNTHARSRLRGGLMVAQVTVSVVLLVGAGLFVRSLREAARSDLGFAHQRIIAVYIEGNLGVTTERRDELYRSLVPRLAELPGVRHVALATGPLPLRGTNEQYGLRVPGMDSIPRQPNGGPYTYAGTEGFVEALGMQIIRGRSFASDEFKTAAPVVMVSESFVRTIWPDQDPLRQCVTLEHADVELEGAEPCRSVVGVYGDLAVRSLVDANALSVAWPSPRETRSLDAIIVHTDGDPFTLVPTVRQLVLGASTDVRFARVNPIAERVAGLLGPWRLGATMFTAFGLLALVVAGVGLYSVLAFGVAQRRRELGIRAALGARRTDLVRLVMLQAAQYVIGGLALGTAIVLTAGAFIRDLLFEVEPNDPVVYGLVIVSLFLCAAVSTLAPAARATSVNPTTAIQAD